MPSVRSHGQTHGHGRSTAVVSNDADAIGKFLSDDWVIIDPNGDIIDKARSLGVIKSGMLTHDLMDSDDVQVRSTRW